MKRIVIVTLLFLGCSPLVFADENRVLYDEFQVESKVVSLQTYIFWKDKVYKTWEYSDKYKVLGERYNNSAGLLLFRGLRINKMTGEIIVGLFDASNMSLLTKDIDAHVVVRKGKVLLIEFTRYSDRIGSTIYSLQKPQSDNIIKTEIAFIESVDLADVIYNKNDNFFVSGYREGIPYGAVVSVKTGDIIRELTLIKEK
jgi:hypothetical protein